MTVDNNQQRWEDIYKNKGPGNFLRYPNEVLVSLFFRYRGLINPDGKALDYGFGSGNNAELLIQHIHNLYGVEISASAVEAIGSRLGKYAGFNAAQFATQFNHGFADFDLILAWQVLCYNTKASFDEKAGELVGKLNKGGVLIASITAHDDIKVTASKKLGSNTFSITDVIPHQEGCVIYSPASVDEFVTAFTRHGAEIVDHGAFTNVSHLTEAKLSEYYLVVKKL